MKRNVNKVNLDIDNGDGTGGLANTKDRESPET